MDTIIKKIFERRFGYQQSNPNDKEYQEAKSNYDEVFEALENTLNEEQKKMLSDLFICEGEVQGVVEFLAFKKGFSAGILIGIEISEIKDE